MGHPVCGRPTARAGAEADLSATLRSGRDDKVVVKKKTADPLRVGVPVRRSLPERGEAMTERKTTADTRTLYPDRLFTHATMKTGAFPFSN